MIRFRYLIGTPVQPVSITSDVTEVPYDKAVAAFA